MVIVDGNIEGQRSRGDRRARRRAGRARSVEGRRGGSRLRRARQAHVLRPRTLEVSFACRTWTSTSRSHSAQAPSAYRCRRLLRAPNRLSGCDSSISLASSRPGQVSEPAPDANTGRRQRPKNAKRCRYRSDNRTRTRQRQLLGLLHPAQLLGQPHRSRRQRQRLCRPRRRRRNSDPVRAR